MPVYVKGGALSGVPPLLLSRHMVLDKCIRLFGLSHSFVIFVTYNMIKDETDFP
jgi:hypothetical protein